MADGDELRLELNTGAGEEEDEVVGAAESPSDPLEFDLLSARGDALPWDSPVRAPGAGKSIQPSARSGTSVVAASEPIEEWLAPPAEAVESARGDNELEPLGPTFESVRETSP